MRETPNQLLDSSVSRFLPGTSDIDSGEAGDYAETYLWTGDQFASNDTYKWERSTNGGAWQTVSTTRHAWVTIQPGSQFKMKLRLTRTVTPLSTPYTVIETFDVNVHTPPLEVCNWKTCN